MENLIVGIVILGILSLSVLKIRGEKKRGVKCVGCPYAGTKGNSGCSCSTKEEPPVR